MPGGGTSHTGLVQKERLGINPRSMHHAGAKELHLAISGAEPLEELQRPDPSNSSKLLADPGTQGTRNSSDRP